LITLGYSNVFILNGTKVNATIITTSRNIIIMTTSNEELNNLFNFETQLENVEIDDRVGDIWQQKIQRLNQQALGILITE
jgi:hypothetical protein